MVWNSQQVVRYICFLFKGYLFEHHRATMRTRARALQETLGTDCFLPFGHCCISLKVPKALTLTPNFAG